MTGHREGMADLLLFDAHNDSVIMREVRDVPMDFTYSNPAYHVDLSRLRSGGMGAMFVMVGDRDLDQSSRMVDAVKAMASKHESDFAVCVTQSEVRSACESGRIALVMSIESQVMFDERLVLLQQWHRLGVQVASISHGEGRCDGPVAALQYDRSVFRYLGSQDRALLRRTEKGLTPFARESLQEMQRLGMVLDLTHANDAAFWDAIEIYDGPICCSHSNCYALCPHARNLTDDMLRALGARRGVLGICLYKPFIDSEQPDLSRFTDHVVHAVEVMGEDNVGIGGDFDGIPPGEELVIPDAAAVPCLWDTLSERGMPTNLIRKIAFENVLHLLPT